MSFTYTKYYCLEVLILHVFTKLFRYGSYILTSKQYIRANTYILKKRKILKQFFSNSALRGVEEHLRQKHMSITEENLNTLKLWR
jgi:hypothetical protein